MSSDKSGVSGTEQFGIPRDATVPESSTVPSLTALSSQVEKLTAAIGLIESRLVAAERDQSDPQVPRPPPTPPFSWPMLTSSAIPGIHSSGVSSTGFTPPFVPPVTSKYIAGLGNTEFHIPQTLPITRPQMQLLTTGATTDPLRPTLIGQPVQQYKPPVPKPQMVNPGSCWGPPPQLPQFRNVFHEPQNSKVRLDPPYFDGSDANNWIRSIQYYFDHVGTPNNHHLHYVIMLFDPPVADWIWSYCSSHEFVTWFEFLDDVHRRFDPTCYQSHFGLISKLRQTGTIAEYQTAFEALQDKVVGIPDHVCILPVCDSQCFKNRTGPAGSTGSTANRQVIRSGSLLKIVDRLSRNEPIKSAG